LQEGQYSRAAREFSPDIVAHQVFHQLLDTARRFEGKKEIRREFLKLHSSVPESEESGTFVGGLIQFASKIADSLPAFGLSELQAWSQVISEVLPQKPQFAMVSAIFNVIARYKESGDEKVLLELPLEQRNLLVGSDQSVSHRASRQRDAAVRKETGPAGESASSTTDP
jgi:hypothetical protein